MRRSQASAVRLEAALAEVEQLDLEGLRIRWQALSGTPAPPSFRVRLLRAAIAYKLQERVLGGLKPSTRSLLRRVAEQADRGREASGPMPDESIMSGGPEPTTNQPEGSVASSARSSGHVVAPDRRRPAKRTKPGTRLLRTWQGTTHEVLVGQGEVTYRGRSYRSLSQVARLITGQRWSGPLFFGLKGRAGDDGLKGRGGDDGSTAEQGRGGQRK